MDILEVVKMVNEKAPHFPDGRIDYTDERVVVKFSAIVLLDGKMLLMKRQDSGEWECVTGYIDAVTDVGQFVRGEVEEETGLEVVSLEMAEPFSYVSGEREYFVQPAVASCRGTVRLNWEHSEWTLERVAEERLSELTRLTIRSVDGILSAIVPEK